MASVVERTGHAVEKIHHSAETAAARRSVPPTVAMQRGNTSMTVIAMALGVFAILFAVVRAGRSDRTDHRITMAIQRRRAPWFRQLMNLVSWPGFPPQSRIIPPLLSLGWWFLGFPLEAMFQLLAWGTGGISFTFKRIMQRPRPSHPDIQVAVANIGGTSFPSGHVLNYIGVYGFLAYLMSTLPRARRLRLIVVPSLAGMLALVGPSRIYLGHHWATDVSASYLLGTSYLVALTGVYRRIKWWLASA